MDAKTKKKKTRKQGQQQPLPDIPDKVAPFYTQEDYEDIRNNDTVTALESVIRTVLAARAKYENDPDREAKMEPLYDQMGRELINSARAQRKIHERVLQRYIDSLALDTSAIMRDVDDILSRVTKAHYFRWLDSRLVLSLQGTPSAGDDSDGSASPQDDSAQVKKMSLGGNGTKKRGYKTCLEYTIFLIEAQLSAFAYYGMTAERETAIAMAEAKAASFYKRPKVPPRLRDIVQDTEEAKAIEDSAHIPDFFSMPESTASNLLYEILGAGGNLDSFAEQKKKVSHGTKVTIRKGKKDDPERAGTRRIILKNTNNEVTIDLSDINKLTSSNKGTKKLLMFAMVKINEQALHNGVLGKDVISFSLDEMVEHKMYKSIRTARAGFLNAITDLGGVQIGGKMQINSKRTIEVKGVHLFRMGWVDNNQCYIRLETSFDWQFMARFFMSLPRYFFWLSNRACDLAYFIFYLARQHAKPSSVIKEVNPDTGREESVIRFNISFRAIQSRMHLPSEKGLNNPQRDIKDVIEDAIAEIEEAHREYYKNRNFSLLIMGLDQEAGKIPISKYLDDGYLQVTLRGEFASSALTLVRRTQQKIDAAQERQNRIVDQAKAMSLAKKMDADAMAAAAAEDEPAGEEE